MQGTLEFVDSQTLARDSMHGYGIAQRIHAAADDLLKGRGWLALSGTLSHGKNAVGSGQSGMFRKIIAGQNSQADQRRPANNSKLRATNWERISRAITRSCKLLSEN